MLQLYGNPRSRAMRCMWMLEEMGAPYRLIEKSTRAMYHEIAQPYGLLYNLVPALKPGARVGIVDAYAPIPEHGSPPDLLRCELAAVGYREISLDRLTGSDAYLAIFAPPSVANRTRPETIVACKAR